MTVATAPGGAGADVDTGAGRIMKTYDGLVKAGRNSVIAAWRFGRAVDRGPYTAGEAAALVGVTPGTIYRYLRLFRAYQRAELALEVAERIESYNVDHIAARAERPDPVDHGRPMRGRHWVYTCRDCRGHNIGRDEVDEEEENADATGLGPLPGLPGNRRPCAVAGAGVA